MVKSKQAILGLFLAQVLAWGGAAAEPLEPAQDFRLNCMSCHTIGGGRLTGPDLKDVEGRRERAWLVRFLQNPKQVIDSGDPYAQKLVQEARGVVMPTLPGMTPARAEALLNLIGAESKLERSQFAGLVIPDTPFSPEDIAQGRALFLGQRPLQQRGPACLACHRTADVPGLGGGKLGPDLTLAYERLGGRRGLATWLSAPATTTMQALFTKRPLASQEALALTAYLENVAQKGGQPRAEASLEFFLLGLGGAVLGLSVFGQLWRFRFRAVRQPLVRGAALRGEE
jgi:mono/diheme cytochrome c family protein